MVSTTARASSVDTDVMEGEKIELDMSRQATAGAIKQHTGSEGFDARGYRDSKTQSMISDIDCLDVIRSRRLVARKRMTTDALRFGGSREGKTTTWFCRTSVCSAATTMYQVVCCERR